LLVREQREQIDPIAIGYVRRIGYALAIPHPRKGTMNYWEDKDLDLHFVSKTDCSVDANAATKYKVKANVPETYVTDLQKDLITLGYLESKDANKDGYFGGGTKRAVTRFQRHALRSFRMLADKTRVDLGSADMFSGTADGAVKQSTAAEIRRWIDKKWTVPVGVIKLVKVDQGGKMREDAKSAWDAIVKSVVDAGGILEGPYGDTLRALAKTGKVGTSSFSMHYCGRAVDINQGFYGKRYFAKKDAVGSDTFWTLYCKTDKQDGTQGTQFKKGDFKYFVFYNETESDIPAGYYIDMTASIQAKGEFSRIKAQTGWNDAAKVPEKSSRYNKTEWWHFFFCKDIQATFQDELELIGFDEKTIRANGWSSDAELDHAPG